MQQKSYFVQVRLQLAKYSFYMIKYIEKRLFEHRIIKKYLNKNKNVIKQLSENKDKKKFIFRKIIPIS